MKDPNEKRMCVECYWRGMATEQLEAPSPFDPEENVVGCPSCKGVDTHLREAGEVVAKA